MAERITPSGSTPDNAGKVPEVFKLSGPELERISKLTGGTAAVPLLLQRDTNGLPTAAIDEVIQQIAAEKYKPNERRIIATANAAYAKATYTEYDEKALRESKPPLDTTSIPWEFVGRLKFLPEFLALPTADQRFEQMTPLTREGILEWIETQANEIPEKGLKAPFYTRAGDPTSQLDVTEYIVGIKNTVLEAVENLRKRAPSLLKLAAEPTAVVVDNTWTRGQRLPTSVAAIAATLDHDSGDCSKLFINAMKYGEKGRVLAQMGDFVLLQTANSTAFVHKDNVIGTSEFQPVVSERGEATPLAFVQHLTNREDTWSWGDNDCVTAPAEEIEETTGVEFSKHSADVTDKDLAGLPHMEVVNAKAFSTLKPGMYMTDMYTYRAGKKRSTHIWTVIVDESGKMTAISSGFALKNDEGKVELPVGLHIAHQPALKSYVEDEDAPRILGFRQIAQLAA